MSRSASPGEWRVQSLNWIDENHPYLTVFGKRSSKEPTPTSFEKLSARLSAVNFYLAEAEDQVRKSKSGKAPGEIAGKWLQDALDGWNREHHLGMVRFFKDGGYKGRVEALATTAVKSHKPAGEDDDLESGALAGLVQVVENSPGASSVEARSRGGVDAGDQSELDDAVTYGSKIAGSW